MNAQDIQRDRFFTLDAFRGMAALGVVLAHFTHIYDLLYGHTFRNVNLVYGARGVELFFILSGFVIFFTIQNVKSPREFLIRRFIRLYPAYWICLIITFTTVSIFGLPKMEVNWKEALVGLTMIQQLFGIPPVDKSYWTLVPEFFFYLTIAAVAWAGWIKKIEHLGIVWLLLSLVHTQVYHIRFVGLFLNLDYTCYFYSGILFFLLKQNPKNSYLWVQQIVCIAIGVFLKPDIAIAERLVIAFIYLAYILFLFDKLKFLQKRPLIYLGRISFAWYLIHQHIGYVIINALKPYIQNHLIFIPPILITLLIAHFITFNIEKPAMKWLKERLLSRRKENKNDISNTTATPI